MDLLDLLFNARTETYTINKVKNACGAFGCWPIDLDKAHEVLDVSAADDGSPAVRALDRPLLIQKLAREVEEQKGSDQQQQHVKDERLVYLDNQGLPHVAENRIILRKTPQRSPSIFSCRHMSFLVAEIGVLFDTSTSSTD